MKSRSKAENTKKHFVSATGDDYELIERKSDGKFNFLKPDGTLLSDIWFEKAENFSEGLAAVILPSSREYNFIASNYLKTDGTLLLKEGCYETSSFRCGYGRVRLGCGTDYVFNFVNCDGEPLNQDGFRGANDFYCGLAVVFGKEHRQNYIRPDNTFLLATWEYFCNDFCQGFGIIEKEVKYDKPYDKPYCHRVHLKKFVNQEGQIIGNQWFRDANNFSEGLAVVQRVSDGKYNYIKPNGRFLMKRWVEFADDFHEGFGIIYSRANACDFVDKNGNRLLNKWVYNVTKFNKEGVAIVFPETRHCYYLIDKQGNNVT